MVSNAENRSKPVLGIIGGVGPLASAEFIKTIYEHTLDRREQETPAVLLYSDPTFPDRTEALLNGESAMLLDRLTTALERLRDFGVSKTVICCVTMHYLLPQLPADLRSHLLSLLDIIFAEVLTSGKKHLLLCSSGTRRLEVFQRHSHWEQARDFLILPEEQDQNAIHELIYRIKGNCALSEIAPFVEALAAKYKVNSLVAGCTEIHLLAKYFGNACGSLRSLSYIDPLTSLAQKLAGDEMLLFLKSG